MGQKEGRVIGLRGSLKGLWVGMCLAWAAFAGATPAAAGSIEIDFEIIPEMRFDEPNFSWISLQGRGTVSFNSRFDEVAGRPALLALMVTIDRSSTFQGTLRRRTLLLPAVGRSRPDSNPTTFSFPRAVTSLFFSSRDDTGSNFTGTRMGTLPVRLAFPAPPDLNERPFVVSVDGFELIGREVARRSVMAPVPERPAAALLLVGAPLLWGLGLLRRTYRGGVRS